jgi:hypothetical protein
MPRELSNEHNEVTFQDHISGDKIKLYFRMPTTAERIKYTNGYVARQNNKIVATIGETRMKAGAAILMGFEKGAFLVPGKGLISSKPGEENYDPEWKATVKQFAPDIIERLAIHAFESSMPQVNSNALEVLPVVEDNWEDAEGGEPDKDPL